MNEQIKTLARVREIMENHGVPGRDPGEVPSATKTFPDGGHFRMEISGVERIQYLEALVDEMQKTNAPVHRIICSVMGATLLPKKELKDFAKLARDAKLEVIMTPGPRIGWDVGRVFTSQRGIFYGGRARGSDNISYFIEESAAINSLFLLLNSEQWDNNQIF